MGGPSWRVLNKTIFPLSFLLAGAVLFVASAASGKDAPVSAEQLRGRLEAALKAHDTNAAMALVNWHGVSVNMKSSVVRELAFLAEQPVEEVKMAPWPQNQPLVNEVNGVRYSPNVRVTDVLTVNFGKKGNNAEIPCGESGGAYYIAAVVEEVFNLAAKKAIPLAISLVGLSPKQSPAIFNCSYVYVAGGKKQTESFRCTNGFGQGFFGDYIKSCQVARISGASPYQVKVIEGGKVIFDSGVETNREFIYRKK